VGLWGIGGMRGRMAGRGRRRRGCEVEVGGR
jgi:hypothetical protein